MFSRTVNQHGSQPEPEGLLTSTVSQRLRVRSHPVGQQRKADTDARGMSSFFPLLQPKITVLEMALATFRVLSPQVEPSGNYPDVPRDVSPE